MRTLTMLLLSGLVITEPISLDDCRDLMGIARYVDATGAALSRPEGQISALKCDGQAIVLMLTTNGDCEVS